MSNANANRVKRLEASANLGEKRRYVFLPDPMTEEEWIAFHCSGKTHETVSELKPLMAGAYVRRSSEHIRSGPLDACIAERRERAPNGPSPPQFWVCENRQEARELISEINSESAFSHAYVFTDGANEMHLGSGRHRIDQ